MVKYLNIITLLIVFPILVFSQNNSLELLPSQYVKWVKNADNGLRKSKIIQGIEYRATPLSTEYMVCNQFRKNDISKEEMEDNKTNYEDYEYFLLEIRVEKAHEDIAKFNISGQAEYDAKIKYMSFEMQRDIKLKDLEQFTKCELYHYERNYGVSPFTSFLVGFPKSKDKEERIFIYNDELFKNGLIKFYWDYNTLTNLPTIKLK